MNKFFALLALIFPAFLSAQNTDGDNVFDPPVVHTIYLNFNQQSYWDTLVENHDADVYTRCSMVFDGQTVNDIGVKLKGNSSYNNPSVKKSMKIDLNEYVSGQTFDGLKKFNLNNGFKDPTFLREKVTLDFLNAQGIAAPRCSYANVYLNNQLWGFYMLVEEVNKDFLDDRFGDNNGNLFKGDPHGDLRWINANPSAYYTNYELDTNEDINDWTDLVWLINIINNTPTAQFHDSMEVALDTDLWIKQWAALNLFANLDSYIGSGHNYYIYHDSTKLDFKWITWDVNEAFGCFNMGMQITQLENLDIFYVNNPTQKPLCNKMLANAAYKQDLADAICYMVHTYFTPEWMDAKIDSLYLVVKPHVYADPNKFYTNQQFETNINSNVNQTPGLKSFLTNRRASVLTQLQTWNCSAPTGVENEIVGGIKIYPNPATGSVTVDFPSLQNLNPITIYNSQGQLMQSHYACGTRLTMDISNYVPGIYFLRTVNGPKLKFVVGN